MTEQEKEIQTIKKRSFELKLSDSDVKRLAEKAVEAELTVEQLLESFIGDLVCGTYSNGSDERMMASQWFDRCGYGFYNNFSLLHYLLQVDEIDSFYENYLYTISCKNDIEENESLIAGSANNWNKYVTSDNKPFYSSEEDYLKSMNEDLESTKESLEYTEKELEECWENFIHWTENKEVDKEKEIAAVIEWAEKYIVEE